MSYENQIEELIDIPKVDELDEIIIDEMEKEIETNMQEVFDDILKEEAEEASSDNTKDIAPEIPVRDDLDSNPKRPGTKEKKQPKVKKEPKKKGPRGRPRIHPIKVKPEHPGKRGRPKTLGEFYVDGKFDNAAYYLANKAKINERITKKVDCDICGKSIRYDYVNIHQKTNICRKNAK